MMAYRGLEVLLYLNFTLDGVTTSGKGPAVTAEARWGWGSVGGTDRAVRTVWKEDKSFCQFLTSRLVG